MYNYNNLNCKDKILTFDVHKLRRFNSKIVDNRKTQENYCKNNRIKKKEKKKNLFENINIL